jgi:UPF0176 protein
LNPLFWFLITVIRAKFGAFCKHFADALDLYANLTHLSMMSSQNIKVAAFYRFHPLKDIAGMRAALLPILKSLGAKGSVLLADEGVNGTLAAPPENIEAVLNAIVSVCGLPELERKYAAAPTLPFLRLKVRLKKEIVTIGDVKANPNERVGEYVEAKDWNALISDPDVVLIDTRNDYEYRVGTFRNAIDPRTESFSAFPKWVKNNLNNMKSKKIAMFCTGGIRCEKASSFMKFEGFEKVYHLKGGILKYLEDVPPNESLWDGACYVFDERVAVGHGLEIADFTTCHGCLEPVSAEDRASARYEEGVCCPTCADRLTDVQKASNRERQKQFELAQTRGGKHLGPVD